MADGSPCIRRWGVWRGIEPKRHKPLNVNPKTASNPLVKAKRLFVSMGCSHFHMARESPGAYDEYQALGITKDLETAWSTEEATRIILQLHQNQTEGEKLAHVYSRLVHIVLPHRLSSLLAPTLQVTITIKSRMSQFERLLTAETIVGRQDVQYRPGLIFFSLDSSEISIAKQFIKVVQELVAEPFSSTEDDSRRQKLLAALAKTIDCCGL